MARLHMFLVIFSPCLARALAPRAYSGTGTDPCSQGLATMYPFGASTSDAIGSTGDDDNAVTLSWAGAPFKFFGRNYNVLYFSTNAWLCFTADDGAYTGTLFPTYAYPVCGVERVHMVGHAPCVTPCCRG